MNQHISRSIYKIQIEKLKKWKIEGYEEVRNKYSLVADKRTTKGNPTYKIQLK